MQIGHFIQDTRQFIGKASQILQEMQETSITATLDDPGLATAVVLVGLIETAAPMTQDEADQLAGLLRTIVKTDTPEQHLSLASWAAREMPDVTEMIDQLLPLWNAALSSSEKWDLLTMAYQVTDMNAPRTTAQNRAIQRLTRGLRLNG